jgi:hypothetical protein
LAGRGSTVPPYPSHVCEGQPELQPSFPTYLLH